MNKQIDDGGPAFPATCSADGIPLTVAYPTAEVRGMTLRDWFAGQALSGLCACSEIALPTLNEYAKVAYAQADAMIAARKEKL